MPWKSEAQRRKFYATPSLHKYIPEFNAATPKGKKLPYHVRRKHHRHHDGINHALRRHGH